MYLLSDSEIHCPQLEISDQELKERVELELNGFQVNIEKLECLERIFIEECDAGLAQKKSLAQLALERSLEASAEFEIAHHVAQPEAAATTSSAGVSGTDRDGANGQYDANNGGQQIEATSVNIAAGGIAAVIHNSGTYIATYEDESTVRHYAPQSEPSRSTFLMANTFIPGHYPNGQEVGDYLSLDLGSTNFRVLWSTFNGHQAKCETRVRFYDVPLELRHGECKKLFDFLASCISNFVDSFDKLRAYHSTCIGTTGEPLKLGLTFSFPTDQTAIDRATLLTWTKSFDCPDAIGQDVVQLLQDSIDRRHDLRVKVIAVLNDTTGTLLQGRFVDPDCAIGMIVGSGGNICYLEKLSTIDRLTGRHTLTALSTANTSNERNDNVQDEVVVDIESGAFGDDGKINFIHTKYDETVDKNSLFKNSFTFEKLYGGNFLGEIVRYILLDFAQQSMIFSGHVTLKMTTKYSLLSAMTSAIESPTCSNEQVCQILNEAFDLTTDQISQQDVQIVRFVVARLFVRNALILSACLAGLIKRMNKPTATIAVDGSVYKKHPKFHKLLSDFTQQLAPKHKFKIIGVEDGSGRGGALAAAIADEISNSKLKQQQ